MQRADIYSADVASWQVCRIVGSDNSMNTLIYGKRRQGKSTLALALAMSEHPVTVVFDPNDQFPNIERISDMESWLGNSRRETSDGKPILVVGRVGPIDTGEVSIEFGLFMNHLWEERDISIIVDEAHMLQGSNSLDPNLDRLNRRSAASVLAIQTTHRIVDAHPDSRYHADDVYFFYAYLPRELKTIRENFGEDVALEVPKLKPFQVIHWHKATGGVPEWEVWEDGSEWFIELGNDNQAA